jgi:hypothetical protein
LRTAVDVSVFVDFKQQYNEGPLSEAQLLLTIKHQGLAVPSIISANEHAALE